MKQRNSDEQRGDRDRSGSRGKASKRVSDASVDDIVLARPLHDGYLAVGLFNRSDQPQAITVKWRDVGLAAKTIA